MIHITPDMSAAIQALLNKYNGLPLWKRIFFPSSLSKALKNYHEENPLSAHAVFHAFSNQTWFFQRLLFSCLVIFSKTEKPKTLNLDTKHVFQLIQTAQQLPQDNHVLDLRNSLTGDLPYIDGTIIPRFLGAGHQATSFNDVACFRVTLLRDTEFVERIITVLLAVPTFITKIDLGENEQFLRRCSEEQLVRIFDALPRNLTALNLAHNYLGGIIDYARPEFRRQPNLRIKPNPYFNEYLRHLPPTLEVLDLSYNELESFSPEQPTCIGPLIKEIGLRGNWKINMYSLSVTLQSLPPNVEIVDLSENHFFMNFGHDLQALYTLGEALLNLPCNLKTLIFRQNIDGDKLHSGYNTLENIFSKFPRELRCLDLSQNSIGRYLNYADKVMVIGDPGKQIDINTIVERAAKALPENLDSLNLANTGLNNLDKLLPSFIANIPCSLKFLDLRKNSFNELTLDEIKECQGTLSRLNRLYITYEEYQAISPAKLAALLDCNIHEKICLIDNDGHQQPLPNYLDWRKLDIKDLSVADIIAACKDKNAVFISYEYAMALAPEDYTKLIDCIPDNKICLIDNNGHQQPSPHIFDLRKIHPLTQPIEEILEICKNKRSVLISHQQTRRCVEAKTQKPEYFAAYKSIIEGIPLEKIRVLDEQSEEKYPPWIIYRMLTITDTVLPSLKVRAAFFLRRHTDIGEIDLEQIPQNIRPLLK